MENTLYVGLSHQMALQRKMDMIANNIANVDTTGFKAGHVLFGEQVVSKNSDKPMSMVLERGNYRDLSTGPLQQTGNPLDIALNGNGFLAVQSEDGSVKFTRNGSMQKNNLGQLVTSSGMPYLTAGGQPLTIPADAHQVIIAKDGTVSTEQGSVGQLQVVRFENPLGVTPVGNSMYETNQDPIPDNTKTVVSQGMLEGSNVNTVMEMTKMIEVMRRYESAANLLKKEADLESSMIQRLSRM